MYICEMLVGCQAAIAGKPAPTGFGVHLQEMGRLSGRQSWQASFHRDLMYICEMLVGYQAAIAGRAAPTGICCTSARDWSAVRPPSRASLAPTINSAYTARFSPLIRPSVSSPSAFDLPAPFGRLSGGVHPGSGAQRRSTQSNTLHVGAAKPTGGQCPRMDTGAKVRRALARGRTFGAKTFASFGAFAKGSRRKGETASRHYRRNGYVHNHQEHGRPKGRQVKSTCPNPEHTPRNIPPH
jgi:hypothetical protein